MSESNSQDVTHSTTHVAVPLTRAGAAAARAAQLARGQVVRLRSTPSGSEEPASAIQRPYEARFAGVEENMMLLADPRDETSIRRVMLDVAATSIDVQSSHAGGCALTGGIVAGLVVAIGGAAMGHLLELASPGANTGRVSAGAVLALAGIPAAIVGVLVGAVVGWLFVRWKPLVDPETLTNLP